jgi:2-methylcitrate dehydratase PrpD
MPPIRRAGWVDIETTDGRSFSGAIDEPKGDPGNTLSRAELEAKFMRLVRFADAAEDAETRALIDRVWALRDIERVCGLRAAG